MILRKASVLAMRGQCRIPVPSVHGDCMKKAAAFVLSFFLALACCPRVQAQNNPIYKQQAKAARKSARHQSRANNKYSKQQQKAIKKSVKAQKKALKKARRRSLR
jgi:hypothetical protein